MAKNTIILNGGEYMAYQWKFRLIGFLFTTTLIYFIFPKDTAFQQNYGMLYLMYIIGTGYCLYRGTFHWWAYIAARKMQLIELAEEYVGEDADDIVTFILELSEHKELKLTEDGKVTFVSLYTDIHGNDAIDIS